MGWPAEEERQDDPDDPETKYTIPHTDWSWPLIVDPYFKVKYLVLQVK